MTSSRSGVGALLALLVASAPVYSQSLGELARQEEARRATAKKAARAFSDGDLRSGASCAVPETSQPCYISVSEGRCLSADEVVARSLANIASPKTRKQEPMIRQEAAAIRGELTRVQQELDQLGETAADESRPVAQAAAADALAKRQRILEQITQRWLKLEKYVEQQRIPREWIGATPDLVLRSPR